MPAIHAVLKAQEQLIYCCRKYSDFQLKHPAEDSSLIFQFWPNSRIRQNSVTPIPQYFQGGYRSSSNFQCQCHSQKGPQDQPPVQDPLQEKSSGPIHPPSFTPQLVEVGPDPLFGGGEHPALDGSHSVE